MVTSFRSCSDLIEDPLTHHLSPSFLLPLFPDPWPDDRRSGGKVLVHCVWAKVLSLLPSTQYMGSGHVGELGRGRLCSQSCEAVW